MFCRPSAASAAWPWSGRPAPSAVCRPGRTGRAKACLAPFRLPFRRERVLPDPPTLADRFPARPGNGRPEEEISRGKGDALCLCLILLLPVHDFFNAYPSFDGEGTEHRQRLMPLSPAKVRPSSTQCSFLGGEGERVFRAGCGPSLRRAHLFSMRFAPPSEGGPVSREIFRCEEERFVSTLRAGRKGRAGGMHFRRKSDRSVHVPPSVQRVPGEAPLRRTALAW